MELTPEQIKGIVVGAVDRLETERGLLFTKYTQKQHAAWKKAAPELLANVEASTGIRLDFQTDSENVTFHVAGGKKYELLVDDFLTEQYRCEGENASFFAKLGRPGQMKRVTFTMPSHQDPGYIRGVTLDDGAIFSRHCFDRKLLFLGDSITQGWNATFDTLSYAYQVSRALNAESVIHGNGGTFYEPTAMDDMGFEADTVIVALGTNDFDRFDSPEEIGSRAKAYLQLVKTQFSQAKIYVITPIWRQDWQEVKKCGSFGQCRETIAAAAQSLELEVIDGLKLMPHFPEFMADPLHPNDLGFSLYAKNLLTYIQ